MVIMVELLIRNSERTQATGRKVLDVRLELVLEILRLVARAELDDDTRHSFGDALQPAGALLAVRDLRALVDGVERLEVEQSDTFARGLGVLERADDARVDGVLVLRARRVGGEEHDVLDREMRVRLHGALVNSQLVRRKGARLVRAQDRHTRQLLNRRDTRDDGLVLRELLRADGERDGEHGGHGDGDTADEQDEDVVETAAVGVVERRVEHADFRNDEDAD